MGFFSAFFQKPLQTELTITSSNGFHLRPVAKFVTVAKKYQAEITALFKGRSVNAKGVNSLLSLSLEKGDSFLLTCKGKDAQAATEALRDTFFTLMEEDHETATFEKESVSYEGHTIEAEVISSGMAIAPAFIYKETYIQTFQTHPFHKAIKMSLKELETLYETKKGEANAEIFLAQKELLSSLKYDLLSLENAEEKLNTIAAELLGTKMEAKIIDYKDILHRIKTNMGMKLSVDFPDTPFILLADDLLPSQIEALSKTKAQAVVLKETAINSHTAILLRGAGIPSLIADISQLEKSEEALILDAHAGLIVTQPTQNDLTYAQKRIKKDETLAHEAKKKRFETACTTAGRQIKVLANITNVKSAQIAKEEGAEGIGLLRTEFLFKKKKPDFERQVAAYEKIFALFDEITVRTLDIGGDKALPYIDLEKENNPFLGIRGIRLFKTHPEIMKEQLLAIFTAAKDKKIKIMFPMVSSVEEFTETKTLAESVAKEHALDIAKIQFGIMIEVPSVLFLLKSFNKVVDFYSIGSNDLTQYLFAIERTHPTLKTNELSPALFNALQMIVRHADKPVSICGELAGKNQTIPKLIDLGIDTLSVSAKNIAKTKETIRHV